MDLGKGNSRLTVHWKELKFWNNGAYELKVTTCGLRSIANAKIASPSAETIVG